MPRFLEAIEDVVGATLFYYAVSPLLKIAAALVVVLTLIAYLTLAERKILGFIQARVGPNRVGPWGLFQPIADVAKLLVKEDIIPQQAIKWAFVLGPCLVVGPALVILAVIPFGPPADVTGGMGWHIADVNVALLFVLAMATIGVYGLILGGWGSNNKFSLLGGLRSAAQMISYEVPQGLSLVVPLLMAGTMSLNGIVQAQHDQHVWYVFNYWGLGLAAFFVYFVAGVAESNRNPFDLPEAESELVAGFHTEYSGMRFALFFLGEYANMIVISAVAVTLFLGGWLAPFANQSWAGFLSLSFLPAGLAGFIWFFVKLLTFLFVYIWFRGTFPRYRFDQLMALGWKWMLPMALATIMLTGLVKVL
jgi:NADH-quinone oxidoreductase subunit H